MVRNYDKFIVQVELLHHRNEALIYRCQPRDGSGPKKFHSLLCGRRETPLPMPRPLGYLFRCGDGDHVQIYLTSGYDSHEAGANHFEFYQSKCGHTC